MKTTWALLVQGYYAGTEVHPRELSALLAAFGVRVPAPSSPEPWEVVREVIASRAGLSAVFFWQDMPTAYYLCREGDPEPVGHIPLTDPLDLTCLPQGLASALRWAINRRLTVATPSAIQRALAIVGFHVGRGLSVSNLRGLPGAVVFHPSNAPSWGRIKTYLQMAMPQVAARTLENEASMTGALDAAIGDELALAVELLEQELSRLQRSRLDVEQAPTGETENATVYGRALQMREMLRLWQPSLEQSAPKAQVAAARLYRAIADVETILNIRKGGN